MRVPLFGHAHHASRIFTHTHQHGLIMAYFAAAYAVIWLIVFVLVFSMRRRQEKVVEQLEMLEEMINEQQQA